MQTVKINRHVLHEVITENRAKHQNAFKTAFEGYRRECVKALKKQLRLIRDNGINHVVAFNEQAPEDHTTDYDRVLKMLEMSVDAEITLTEHEFRQYVQDEWQWKRAWTVSNMKYGV